MRSRQPRRAGDGATAGHFAALGLPARPDLTDDDVRAAWRRIAAATHPDRDDGGDPPRFAAAAAAYATLRTPYARGEALADMRAAAVARPRPRTAAAVSHVRYMRDFMTWVPGRRAAGWRPLALRLLAAAAACAGSLLAAGWSPGTAGVVAGALTWLAVTVFRQARP